VIVSLGVIYEVPNQYEFEYHARTLATCASQTVPLPPGLFVLTRAENFFPD
jgi:hypothetical protein